jgi:neutral ceramidase
MRPLRAGAGEAVVDLPIGHSTAGYAQTSVLAFKFPKNDPGSPFADLFPATRGMQSAPKAKALVLDNGAQRLAIVKIDAIFTTDVLLAKTVQLARERLHRDYANRIILSATHTHGAGCRFATSLRVKLLQSEKGWRQDAVGHGVDSFNPESVNRMAASIVEALGRAEEALQPAALGYARGTNTDAHHDRRCQDDALYGAGNIDDTLAVIRVDAVDEATGASTAPLAVLYNFAMHGTTYGEYNANLSIDAPGTTELKLEERFGKPITAMFMQGTAGDVSPSGDGDGSQRMEDIGYRLAESAFRLYNAVTLPAGSDPDAAAVVPLTRDLPMRLKSRRIPLNHDLLGYAHNEFYDDGAILCMMGVNDDCPAPGADGKPGDVTPINPSSGGRCLGIGLPGQGKYHTDIFAAELGPLTLVTVPGEPVSEIGRLIRAGAKQAGLGEVLVYGYAQDHNGYILMPDDWLRGGYEPTISYWGWKFAPYLVEQEIDMLTELAGGAPRHRYAAPRVRYPSTVTVPAPAAPGAVAPAIEAGLPAAVTRMTAVTLRWQGGDPVLGLPHVTIERRIRDEWGPLLRNGWRPVDNHGYEIVTQYDGAPSYATFKRAREIDPQGPDRWGVGKWRPEHRWLAQWGVPAWVPVGTYRFKIEGETVTEAGGAPAPFALTSAAFQIGPRAGLTTVNACDADADGTLDSTGDYFRVTTDAAGVHVSLAAFYPQAEPRWEQVYSGGGQQVGNFRLWSERGSARFPVAGEIVGQVTVKRDGLKVGVIPLPWRNAGGTAKLPAACPGDVRLPAATGDFAWAGPGAYTVEYLAGDVADVYGNALAPRVSAAFAH